MSNRLPAADHRRCREHGSAGIVLAHNHPAEIRGRATPTAAPPAVCDRRRSARLHGPRSSRVRRRRMHQLAAPWGCSSSSPPLPLMAVQPRRSSEARPAASRSRAQRTKREPDTEPPRDHQRRSAHRAPPVPAPAGPQPHPRPPSRSPTHLPAFPRLRGAFPRGLASPSAPRCSSLTFTYRRSPTRLPSLSYFALPLQASSSPCRVCILRSPLARFSLPSSGSDITKYSAPVVGSYPPSRQPGHRCCS